MTLAKRLTISSISSLFLAFAIAFIFWNSLTGRILQQISLSALTELTNVYFETSRSLAENFFSRYESSPEEALEGQLGVNAFQLCPDLVWTSLIECPNLPSSLAYLDEVITPELVDQWWTTYRLNGNRRFTFETVTPFLENPRTSNLPVIGYVKLDPLPDNPTKGNTIIYAQAMHTLLARSVSFQNQILRAMWTSTIMSLFITLGSLGITFIILRLRLNKFIQTPVTYILSGLNEIQKGHYQTPIHLSGPEEFSQIAQQINILSSGTRTLIHEVHHRVKNNMQIVGALLEMQRMETDSPEAACSLDNSYARINAMAMIHELLYTTRDFTSVEPLKYCQSLISFYQQNNPEYVLEVDLSQVTQEALESGTLTTLGLILNELIINSFKHGFTLSGTNHLALVLHFEGTQGFFQYTDRTEPPRPSIKPTHQGFGTELIWNLTAQLDTTHIPDFLKPVFD